MAINPVQKVTVLNCQRCGKTHTDLKFKPLKNPADEWDWWAMCPATRQPLLMMFVVEGGEGNGNQELQPGDQSNW